MAESKSTSQQHTLPAWTEVEYTALCKTPYLSAPLFIPKESKCYLCREDGTREEQRMIFLVFRPVKAEDGGKAPLGLDDDDWDDDPTPGEIWVKPLADDEEVEPARAIYLGMDIDDFIHVEHEDDERIIFDLYWRHGSVGVEKSEKTDEGFVCRKEDFGDEGLRLTLTPKKGGEPFSMQLQIPYIGFSLYGPDDKKVHGDVDVPHDKVGEYRYEFVGNESNDRFSLHLDGDKMIYMCVLRPNAKLAVRDQRDRMSVVDEIPSEGTLDQLLMNAHEALVKNKNYRWRIAVGGSSVVEAEELAVDADSLVAFAKEQYDKSDDKDSLGAHLVSLEGQYNFQWWWLKESDWSPEDAGFDMFMKMLTAFSFVNCKPIQGDLLQARNNKRRLRRDARLVVAHQRGELDLFSQDEDVRKEIIRMHATLHSPFVEAIEEEKKIEE